MPNPFYESSFRQPNYIQDLYKAISQSKNPYQTFITLAGNNPQLQPIVNVIKSGGNPQAIFNDMCKQRGVNPEEFLKSITG